jgi:hypothetical protein
LARPPIFNAPKVGVRAKTFASTPPETPKNGALGAPKTKNFAFDLFGAFEHEAQEIQEKPIENLFACLIGGAKTIVFGLKLLVPKVGG